MKKRNNFPINTKVTWKGTDGSWLKSLQQKHGDGPFKVYDTTFMTYGTPHVKIMTDDDQVILGPSNGWFNSSCFSQVQ